MAKITYKGAVQLGDSDIYIARTSTKEIICNKQGEPISGAEALSSDKGYVVPKKSKWYWIDKNGNTKGKYDSKDAAKTAAYAENKKAQNAAPEEAAPEAAAPAPEAAVPAPEAAAPAPEAAAPAPTSKKKKKKKTGTEDEAAPEAAAPAPEAAAPAPEAAAPAPEAAAPAPEAAAPAPEKPMEAKVPAGYEIRGFKHSYPDSRGQLVTEVYYGVVEKKTGKVIVPAVFPDKTLTKTISFNGGKAKSTYRVDFSSEGPAYLLDVEEETKRKGILGLFGKTKVVKAPTQRLATREDERANGGPFEAVSYALSEEHRLRMQIKERAYAAVRESVSTGGTLADAKAILEQAGTEQINNVTEVSANLIERLERLRQARDTRDKEARDRQIAEEAARRQRQADEKAARRAAEARKKEVEDIHSETDSFLKNM